MSTLQREGRGFRFYFPDLQALRQEKSRDAARSHWGKGNPEFCALAKLSRLSAAAARQLAKASVIRRRGLAGRGPCMGLGVRGPTPDASVKGRRTARDAPVPGSEGLEARLRSHISRSLDGFVFALNQKGEFLYTSETVSIDLGLSRVELTGSGTFDSVHRRDHVEVAGQPGTMRSPGRVLL